MIFNKADFIASYGISSQLPESDRPELSFSGRSNVGKSSLINKLCCRKNLARVSSTPGKTATINFYAVALREAVFHQQAAAFRGEPQQPQLIGKGGGGTAQSGGGLLLRGAGAAEIGGDGGGLLQVVQVPALDIFDKGQQGGFGCLRLYPETGDA